MFCWASLLTLQLIVSQSVGQQIGEVCSASPWDPSNILCMLGNSPTQSNVRFIFHEEGDSLHITCNENPSAEEFERYLASVTTLKKTPVNLSNLKLKGCPLPGGSQSFGTWLSVLGSPLGSLRSLRSISGGEESFLKSFAGLENLTTLELSGSLETAK